MGLSARTLQAGSWDSRSRSAGVRQWSEHKSVKVESMQSETQVILHGRLSETDSLVYVFAWLCWIRLWLNYKTFVLSGSSWVSYVSVLGSSAFYGKMHGRQAASKARTFESVGICACYESQRTMLLDVWHLLVPDLRITAYPYIYKYIYILYVCTDSFCRCIYLNIDVFFR